MFCFDWFLSIFPSHSYFFGVFLSIEVFVLLRFICYHLILLLLKYIRVVPIRSFGAQQFRSIDLRFYAGLFCCYSFFSHIWEKQKINVFIGRVLSVEQTHIKYALKWVVGRNRPYSWHRLPWIKIDWQSGQWFNSMCIISEAIEMDWERKRARSIEILWPIWSLIWIFCKHFFVVIVSRIYSVFSACGFFPLSL